jgi:hypothetical protein
MSILPSTLEYTAQALEKKIALIITNLSIFKELSQQRTIELHVDLVYPFFARERGVMSSLSLTDNIKAISNIEEDVYLTVHFMGTLDDVTLFNLELESIVIKPNITIELYVPTNMNPRMFVCHYPIYHWFDINEYRLIESVTSDKKLLMTVKAGKSGQTLQPDTQRQATELIKQYPQGSIIVDGGWQLSDYSKGLNMVSYSSFWKEFSRLTNHNSTKN